MITGSLHAAKGNCNAILSCQEHAYINEILFMYFAGNQKHYGMIATAWYIITHVCRKLRTSDAGQMVLNMSVAQLCSHTALTVVMFQSIHHNHLMCFMARMFWDYLGFVYMFLITAEAVNMFVKLVLVFRKIDHFPLKASLVSWSKLSCCRILLLITCLKGIVFKN